MAIDSTRAETLPQRHLVDAVVPLLRAGGVWLMLSGHEHNFQHNHVDGIDYIVTGSAGKLPRVDRTAWSRRGRARGRSRSTS